MRRAALLAVSAVVAFALASCASSAPPEAAAPPTATAAPAEPSAEAPLTTEEHVNELKIPAGMALEGYAEVLLEDRFSAWSLAGAGQEYFDERTAERQGDSAIEDRIAAEQAQIYANALLVPGWNSSENLETVVANKTEDNSVALGDWAKAYDFDGSLGTPEWDEGMVVELVEPIEEAADGRKFRVAGYQWNNAAETSNTTTLNADLNGAPWDFTITTRVIDGFEYVSEWAD